MDDKKLRWLFLLSLALIWGSSFILMKKALISLSAIQVGSLRVLISALFLVAIGYKRIFKIQKKYWGYIILNGFIGSFIPVYLYAYAVDNIDSSIVSILNSLTPLNTLLIGILFFGFPFLKKQFLGIFIGLLGTSLLIFDGFTMNPSQDYRFSGLIIIASICYAFNVNILKRHLQELDALSISVGNFIFLIIPSFIVLYQTNIFSNYEINETTSWALVYVAILAILGTGIATILYNRLTQITTPVFSSSVTYLIPIVAIGWGVFDGEKISLFQLFSGLLIVLGVYLVNLVNKKGSNKRA